MASFVLDKIPGVCFLGGSMSFSPSFKEEDALVIFKRVSESPSLPRDFWDDSLIGVGLKNRPFRIIGWFHSFHPILLDSGAKSSDAISKQNLLLPFSGLCSLLFFGWKISFNFDLSAFIFRFSFVSNSLSSSFVALA